MDCGKVEICFESKFEVLFGKLGRHVIRTKEDKDNPSCYQRSVQKPASLMVWGCMSACGMGSLHIWKGTINAESVPTFLESGLYFTLSGRSYLNFHLIPTGFHQIQFPADFHLIPEEVSIRYLQGSSDPDHHRRDENTLKRTKHKGKLERGNSELGTRKGNSGGKLGTRNKNKEKERLPRKRRQIPKPEHKTETAPKAHPKSRPHNL
ncbi:hypothetical protein QTP70_009203 [Hemibagrus guttatus]|uniref:Uncharacterized protein n=1 Tax=Hemibagrus guttatus TaxID=175788 RepID=A0AAE0RK21_9TELE|nr:hypothetical protein QTP70_009203 [Hemibagrus guttatus]